MFVPLSTMEIGELPDKETDRAPGGASNPVSRIVGIALILQRNIKKRPLRGGDVVLDVVSAGYVRPNNNRDTGA